MKAPESINELWSWIGGALGIVALSFGIRRKASVDNLSTDENRSKASWIAEQAKRIAELQVRNDQCERESAVLLGRVERLTAEVGALTDRLDRQTQEMHRIEKLLVRVRPDLRDVFGSDFGNLE